MGCVLRTCALLALGVGMSTGAQATLITTTLGNAVSGFNDGDVLAVFLVGDAQTGQPAPFDTSYGTDIDLFGEPTNFVVNWVFNYAPIAAEILGASLTIGIYDHDSAASGSQLASYLFEGSALTASLDALFEAGGGSTDGQYNIYTIVLGSALFAALGDGSAAVSLALQGPGLISELNFEDFSVVVVESPNNGANLIFSTLAIETADEEEPPPPTPVPEPAALSLFLTGLAALLWRRRRDDRRIATAPIR